VKRLFALMIVLTALGFTSCGSPSEPPPKKYEVNPVVEIDTSKGKIKVELYPDKAPKTVDNFLRYVEEKHYDGTIFHRVKVDFMIQGGGFTENMKEKSTYAPIKLESNNDMSHDRGTIAMARTGDPNSATDQFFINVKNNPILNYQNSSEPGYTAFGLVIEGMAVVDKIRAVETATVGGHEDVPVDPVLIKSIRKIK
jgi:cyclophilin family peptidyl-prolyl cis-trans isomerase